MATLNEKTLDEKRKDALLYLGNKWVCHKSNHVQKFAQPQGR